MNGVPHVSPVLRDMGIEEEQAGFPRSGNIGETLEAPQF
jgi:hypothetical protein